MYRKRPAREMSGAPTLVYWTILLICLTILPTTTQRRTSYLENKDSFLYICDHDACVDMFHTEGKKVCLDALKFFLKLKPEDRKDCPNARDAECRIVNRDFKCTFICDPTEVEAVAAFRDGRAAEPTTKTLRSVTISMREYLNETHEQKQQRDERLRQRELYKQEMVRHNIERERYRYRTQRQHNYMQLRLQGQQLQLLQPQPMPQQELQQLRPLPLQQEQPPQLQLQQPFQPQQQGQQQLQLSQSETARLRRRQRTEIRRNTRSQRPRVVQ